MAILRTQGHRVQIRCRRERASVYPRFTGVKEVSTAPQPLALLATGNDGPAIGIATERRLAGLHSATPPLPPLPDEQAGRSPSTAPQKFLTQCAADAGPDRGASEEHIRRRSVTSEQRRAGHAGANNGSGTSAARYQGLGDLPACARCFLTYFKTKS